MNTATASRVLERFAMCSFIAVELASKPPKKQLEDLKRQRKSVVDADFYYGTHYDAARAAKWYLEGVPGWRFTADTERSQRFDYDQDVLVIEAPNHKTFRAINDPSAARDAAVYLWLRDETNYVDALDAKIVAITAQLKGEAHKKKQGKPVPAGHGTCPCCFGAYKLRRSGGGILMVIHGYERPGIGYIQGRCHGDDFAPLEISKEGTESWVKCLRANSKPTQNRSQV